MRFILLLLLFASCGIQQNAGSDVTRESPSIVFLVLTIHRQATEKKSVVELVSQTQTPGTIKKQEPGSFISPDYLGIYLYTNKKLTDSILVEHPLYKHFEYVNNQGIFTAKDTLLDKADFSVRLQVYGHSNEVKIFEKLKEKNNREEIATIKISDK